MNALSDIQNPASDIQNPASGIQNPASRVQSPLLAIHDLRTYFRTGAGLARSVDGVSFSIQPGETFALVGESGCGKSVTALSILQLVARPAGYIAGGQILLNGVDLVRLPPLQMRRIRGNKVSMIFQEPMTALNPVFTAGNQVAEVLRLHQKLSTTAARTRSIELLHSVGIPEPARRFNEYPHQLSGGMRQRVMIAMALACRPQLLIADEPTTALDVTIQSQILLLMRELQKQMGTAILLITHDMGVVHENADRVGVMYAGKMVEQASRDDIFRAPSHPYTRMLLRSIPSRTLREHALETIPGIVPQPTDFPAGCRFSTRCPFVMDRCRTEEPPAYPVEHGHTAACFLLDPAGSRGRQSVDLEPRPAPPSALAPDVVRLTIRDLAMHFPIRRGLLQRTVDHARAVDGVNLTIAEGETLALVGESGCGKTTVGKCIVRLLDPTAGSIYFYDDELASLSRKVIKPFRRRIQMIFQDPFSSLNPRLMVRDIIADGMETHQVGGSRRDRIQRMASLLPDVGLDPDMLSRYPHEFSGGQRQRIGIARALALGPELLICDEATSSLDVSVRAQIVNLLKELQSRMALSYLFITHDLSVVRYLADRISVMYLGRIVEEGTNAEVFEDPQHPYTRALLSAVPQVDETGRQQIVLSGDVPSLTRPPSGCHFHPRCPEATPECAQDYPAPVNFSDSHYCRCIMRQ